MCHKELASVILVSVLVLSAPFSSPVLAQDVRLGMNVVPTSQRIELELDAGTPTYNGSVGFELLVRNATNSFQFHAEAMNIESVSMLKDEKLVELTYEVDEEGVVTVTTKYTLKPGPAEMGIIFNDDFNTDAVGLYRVDYEGEAYLFSQFQADDAREAFPCWDEPKFKIPFQMILTVPEGHIAVTNTPIENEAALPDGRTRITFAKTKPLPSYLLAIATGPLETVEIPGLGVPGRLVTVKGQSHLNQMAVETTAPLLKALEEYFGSKYPYAKLDLIAVPEYWAGAMENPGAITWRDTMLLLDPKTATVSQKRYMVKVNAHELAHMWFGDLVTLEWWDDLWLNESFADWMGDKIADQVYPEYKATLTTTTDIQRIMLQDARPSTGAIRREILSTDKLMEDVFLAYNKGKAVLAMFELWLGEEDFQKGVVDYVNANAWGSATSEDLWKSLDKASGKKLSKAMSTFVDQPGIPMVTCEIQKDGKLKLSQNRFHNYGITVDPYTYSIPVGIKYARNGTVETKVVLLEKKSMTVDLGGEVDWFLPNAQSNGYYRWSIPADKMAVLAKDAPEKMNARERIGFVSNQIALVTSGSLGGDEFLSGLAGLAEDREPLVLTTVLDALDGVKQAFVPEEDEAAFSVYVSRTLRPALDWCGTSAKPGEDETMSLIRPRLIAWMGDEGRDPAILAFAQEQAKAYMADPESIDPSLASTVLRLTAYSGDMALYEEYKKRAENSSNPGAKRRYLGSMGAFHNESVRDAALDYSLNGPVMVQDMFAISQVMGSTPGGSDRVYRWMTENYDAILAKIPAPYAAYMALYGGGCSEERLLKAKEFFSDPSHQPPGLMVQLQKVEDQVNDCTGLRKREGEAVSRYLHELSEGTGED